MWRALSLHTNKQMETFWCKLPSSLLQKLCKVSFDRASLWQFNYTENQTINGDADYWFVTISNLFIIASESLLACLGAIQWSHWARVTHICVSEITSIGSDNCLSPDQAIIWIDDEIFLRWPLETSFRKNVIEVHTFALMKMHLKMSSGKCRPFCLGFNVVTGPIDTQHCELIVCASTGFS